MAPKSDKKTKIFSIEEVSKVLRLKRNELKEFEKVHLFQYADKAKKKIDLANLARLKVALSLKREYGVNGNGIGVIFKMRERMTRMQKDFNLFLVHVRKHLASRLDKNFKEIKRRS